MSLSQVVIEKFLIPLLTLLGAVITAASPFILARWDALLKARVKNEEARGFGERLALQISEIVKDISAHELVELKAGIQDGTLTMDEKKKLRAIAVDKLKAQLGPEGTERAKTILQLPDDEQLQAALEAKVSAAVFGMKVARAAATAATPVSVLPTTGAPSA